jgi:hypothetical protein
VRWRGALGCHAIDSPDPNGARHVQERSRHGGSSAGRVTRTLGTIKLKLLITGATGKVGTHFLPALLKSRYHAGWGVRALCNNRVLEMDTVEIVRGSLADRQAVDQAMAGVTHVLHMAAVKESPDLAMDVGVKGMFNLLEAFRTSSTARQFILLGGDCSVGHIFQDYDAPITEASSRRGMACAICAALASVAMTRWNFAARDSAAWPVPVAQSQANACPGAFSASQSNSASG